MQPKEHAAPLEPVEASREILRDRALPGLCDVSEKGDVLTHRERQTLARLGEGRTSKEIASELGFGPGTVVNDRKNIRRKLALHSTADLVQFATLWVLMFGDSDV